MDRQKMLERMTEAIAKGQWQSKSLTQERLEEIKASLARRAAGAPSGLPDFITQKDAQQLLKDINSSTKE